jgi:glycosyltransferase involved in cell wall biosynthesis
LKDFLSIVTPTYNEVDNIGPLSLEIKKIFNELSLDYEHIIIDNCSTDGTIEKIKNLASKDKNIKVIINLSNYGHIRSPYYGLLQSSGDATILMCSDFQHPPKLIKEYYNKWKNERPSIIFGRKIDSEENILVKKTRNIYYKFLNTISEIKLPENCTGDGLYDKSVIEHLKNINETYPYLRGLLPSLGFKIEFIDFNQPLRRFGKSNNNFFSLFDYAILGIVKHSYLPLRAIIFLGLFLSIFSIIIAIFFLIYKLLNWQSFSLGIAPLLVGFFTISGIQMLLIGFIGEYLISISKYVNKHPIVIEKERINFK